MEGSVRFRGAAIAVGLWLPLALLFTLPQDPRGVALAIAGLIVSPTIGSLLALQARNTIGLGLRTALLFGVGAVTSGAWLWGLTFAVVDGRDPAEALGFAGVGLIFLGIPLLILGTLYALAWIPLVRRAAH